MKWTTVTGLALALGLVGIVAKGIVSPSRQDPAAVLADVRDRSEVPSFDRRQALRELERALSHPIARQDDDLAVELLMERAKLFEMLGAIPDARLEVERVLGVYRPDDVTLQLRSAELQAKDGLDSEALQKVSQVIERDPSQGAAWRLRGRLEVRLGEAQLAQAMDRSDELLIAEDFEEAAQLLPRIAAMDKNDSSRARLLHELRRIYTERKSSYLSDVLEMLDSASRYYAQARNSYARAFSEGIEPEGLRAWLELLVLAGKPEMAIDYGVSTRMLPHIRRDPDVMAGLLEAMSELGQTERMIQLVTGWPWDSIPAPPEFYRRSARALFKAGDRRALVGPIQELRKIGTPTDRAQSAFYLAVISQDRGKWENSINQLENFLETRPLDPVPGARAEAYRMLARAWREQGRPRDELRAVRGAIEVEPETNGEDYLRLVELQRSASTVSYRIPEENWTRGMALLPERTEELMPTWRILGETSLRNQDLDFDEVYERIRQFQQSRPADVGPYTIYRIAERHLELGNTTGAIAVARGLIEDYPGLLPAVDLTLEAMLINRTWYPLGRMLLQRLRLVGADELTHELLKVLPDGVFTESEVLEIMSIDPYGMGREIVARHMLQNGEPERALRAVRLVEGQADGPELRLLRARALLELERWDAAAEEVADMVLDPRYDQRAFPLMLNARLQEGSPENVEATADELLARDPVPRELMLGAARQVLDAGQLAVADRLLTRLDSAPETRGGDVLHLMALRAALAGDRVGALEALERAEAFGDDGRAEVLRVALLADARAWQSLPRAVIRLEDTSLTPSSLQAALLPLFGERLDVGRERASEGLQRNPTSPSWALAVAGAQLLSDDVPELPEYFGPDAGPEAVRTLRGTAEAQRDPREILALLLAVDMDGWALWVRQRTRAHFEEGGGSLWLQFLDAQASERLGNPLQAEVTYDRLTKGLPEFGPGWDRLQDAVRERHPTNPLHPEMLRVLANRSRAQGPAGAVDLNDLLLASASRNYQAGRVGEAVEVLVRGLRQVGDSDLPIPRLFLARLTAELGQYADSAQQYRLVLATQEPTSDHPWVPEFLDLLSRASSKATARRDQLSEVEVAAILDELQERRPADPLISLARLQSELASDSRNVPLSVRRAEGALRILRREGGERTLEELRPGSSAAWMEFLLELSPDLASEQLDIDQRRSPGDLYLWTSRARTFEAQSQFQEAETAFAHILAMSDEPIAHGEYARLLTRRGAPLQEVEMHLKKADAALGRGNSARTSFLTARGTLYSKRAGLGRIVGRLRDLWAVRDEFRDEVPPLELGRVYATTLFLLASERSMQTLEVVTDDLARYTEQDPYAPDLVQAYTSLVRVAQATQGEWNPGDDEQGNSEAPAATDGSEAAPNQE